jgi:hypothetical protein
MDAQFNKFAGRFIRYWRQLPIALLAVTVFALGLHAKLSLYEPASPVVLLAMTKLSVGDSSDKAILPQRKRSIKASAIETAATLLFFLTSQSASADLRHNHQRGLARAGFLLRQHYAFLFFRPPPSPSFA